MCGLANSQSLCDLGGSQVLVQKISPICGEGGGGVGGGGCGAACSRRPKSDPTSGVLAWPLKMPVMPKASVHGGGGEGGGGGGGGLGGGAGGGGAEGASGGGCGLGGGDGGGGSCGGR